MKKKILALVLVASNFAMFAQQWTGSTTNTGTITHLGPINVDLSTQIGTGANKITFNPGWNMSNALGCIGFNFWRDAASNWTYSTDGANNGAGLFWLDVGGNFMFSAKPTLNGTTNGSLSHQQMLDNIKFRIGSDGRIGINTSSPTQQLDVVGTIKSSGPILTGFGNKFGSGMSAITLDDTYNSTTWGMGGIGFNLTKNGSNWTYGTNGWDNGSALIYAGIDGSISFSNRLTTGASGATSGSLTGTDIVNNKRMQIFATGKVVIGNVNTLTIPGTYKLYVQDGILTEKVKVAVKNTADWSDYVFAPNYKLKPLIEVAAYIEKNKHLPDVPSAQEVVNNGVDMAKMDATLLQKVEELTLYMIELKKENEELKKMIVQSIEQTNSVLKNNK